MNRVTGPVCFALVLLSFLSSRAQAQSAAQAGLDNDTRQLSRDIFRQLIEINTTDSVGSTTLAANAMAKRLLDAGLSRCRRASPRPQ